MKNKIYISIIIILLFSCMTFEEKLKSDDLSLAMAFVEAGSFKMGSNELDKFFEKPEHDVLISRNFYISKYEMTNLQVVKVYNWGLFKGFIKVIDKTVLNINGEEKDLLDIKDKDCDIKYNGSSFYVKNGRENYPCIEISWYGAIIFCNILSTIEGKREVYETMRWTCNFDLNGYRLPTEAEWEYAAQGGKKAEENSKFSGGNNPDIVGWFDKNSGSVTHPVGSKAPNQLGLYDMSGNVWEWCWDWHNRFYYYFSPSKDPTGPQYGRNKVIRGGSWYLAVYNTRCKSRLMSCDPNGMGHHGGFRVVRNAGFDVASK